MLIEQKIEVNGQKVSITRTIQYADKTGAAANSNRPADLFSASSETPANADVDYVAKAIAQSEPKASPAPKGGQSVRLFVLRPGGNLEELGPGGGLEDLGPGGNLAAGVTVIFGGVNIECCCGGQHAPAHQESA